MPQPGFDPRPAPRAPQPPSLSLRAQAVAMILVLALGAAEGIGALTSLRGREVLRGQASPADLLHGRTAQAVNTVMARDLPSDALLRAAGGVLRWVLFRSAGPQVSPGCANWLFLTEELRPWPRPQRAMEARADALRAAAARARLRGVRLLVALVPDKARIESAALCGVRYPAQARARYAAFIGLAHARGVQVVDLDAAFRQVPDPGALYYRTDSHWSQQGAARAAGVIAATVPAGLLRRDGAFRTDTAPLATARPGDLLRLMSLDQVPDGFGLRPVPDWQQAQSTRRIDAAPAGGLLDTPPPPQVALLGSSFSLNGNFLGSLEQALGTQVAQFAQAGGGFSGSAAGYFQSQAWKDTPPRLVIWEVPERAVDQPIMAEEARGAEELR
jgi:alginate O-acetyltransferase complex protein AlgJ